MSDDLFWPNRRIDTGFETAEALANCYNRDNWRAHPEVQRLATEESLDTLGWIGQVKKSTVTGLMFDGHLRVELALLKNPQMLLPVDYYDLDEDETAFALTIHDSITEQAQPIPDKLAALMERTREMTAERPGLRAMLEQLRERAGVNGHVNTLGWDDAFGKLPDGDKSPFQQMTFTLHDSQMSEVVRALNLAKQMGDFTDSPNENSNGNALNFICETFITTVNDGQR